jgi:ABC-type spermidine/putrescine transport system permease subunit I
MGFLSTLIITTLGYSRKTQIDVRTHECHQDHHLYLRFISLFFMILPLESPLDKIDFNTAISELARSLSVI